MVIVEKSFPRGGVSQNIAATADKNENIIFGATQLKKKSDSKQNKNKFKDAPNEEEDRIEIASAGLVNYQTLQDGMIMLGIVKSVDEICVRISLPGRIIAKVLALSISDSYTKNVSEFVNNSENVENYKPLTEMYKIGQLVYGKVMEIKEQEHGFTEVSFSLKPRDVHSELVHTNIKKGFVFNGAIEEVQEHGYIIESGIKNLRCFLPIEKSEPGHAVGQSIFMKVEDIKQSSSATTIRCKEINESSLKIKDQIDPNLDYLLPTTIVNFTVTKHLKDGLQGTLMNGTFTGYINEHNLKEALGSITDVALNSTLNARILYTAPLTKFVYLSLNLFDSQEESTVFKRGEIVQGAAVHHIGNGGVVCVLNNKYKGLISMKSIKANHIGNFDMDQMLNKYTKKSKHTVRILDYDLIGGFFVCTDDPGVVNEKVFTVGDISPGDIVTATVTEKDKKTGGYALQIGKVSGIIEKIFLSPASAGLSENSKIKCRVLAVNTDRNFAHFTNLTEYLLKDCKILTSLDDAKVNHVFLGTIVKCENTFAVVKFFNNIKGIIYLAKLKGIATLFEGQTMHFRIISRLEDNIVVGLPEDTFELGEFCKAKVTHVMDTGLEIEVESKQEDSLSLKALIPDRLLSDYPELTAVKLRTYSIGQEITACCISRNIFSIRDLFYFQEGTIDWKQVKVGDIIRAFIKDVQGDIIELVVPIKGYNKTVKVHRKMLLLKAVKPGSVIMVPEQVIYVKILSKDKITKTIAVSAKLPDVWQGNLTQTGEYFAKYLTEISEIKKALKKQKNPIAQLAIGEKILANYQGSDADTEDWLMEVEKTKVMGLIKKSVQGKQKPPKEGESVECIVLWVDYLNNIVYLTNNKNDISRITKGKNIPENLVNKSGINAKIILKLENAIICTLKKGQNPLAYIPTRLHYNDFDAGCTNMMKEGEFCKLAFIHETLPIAVFEETQKLWRDLAKHKRKLEKQMEEMPPVKKVRKVSEKDDKNAEKPVKDGPLFYEDRVPSAVNISNAPANIPRKRTLEQSRTPLQQEKKKPQAVVEESKTPISKVTLPGATNFWSTDLSSLSATKPEESSSDDDEEPSGESENKKKKKQTSAEKFKAAREEEARLREIEEKYANPDILPETTDQFDRLVLSGPNDSKNWINYMVFHLQAMEIDKARAVARRALKGISFRESEELINIWVALLNLELRYGTKENFNDVLKESLMSSDQLKIYMRVLEILAEANKTQELIELVGTVTKKFKEKMEIWKSCAIALYKVGIHDRAQQMMHKALAVLPEREHVNTIVAFANLTHKYSKTPETAHALLDQVVTSYPKRVDVWSQLIDMLIKDDQIESARRTLERAVIQKIPLKKMRTIFKKYLEFEQHHGTPENVEKVKAQAAEYVKNNS
ncbi:protein RRP5 homolog [Episyrphus balteatus]|uniref:protein RRP5 homolog n=1 Tax=Episyrphus balteatus TaxID=286459 RepID=UPI002484F34C|nr:protein RRP5 homolog [Episyrphus balteatus]